MNIRPPVKWHGGKYYLADWIISHFPAGYEKMTYVEPFGGGASALLQKQPSQVEVYNDIDARLNNLFYVLHSHSDSFIKHLSLTPYSEAEYKRTKGVDELTDRQLLSHSWSGRRVVAAVNFYILCRQSIGGRGDSFALSKHRVRGGMADNVSAWLSSIDQNLPKVIKRLRTVQILCRDTFKVIEKFDSPNTLFYLDPPYLQCTRKSPEVFKHEFTSRDHYNLLELVSNLKGFWVLSGYNNPLYSAWADVCGWQKVEKKISNHAAGGKGKRVMTECLWFRKGT